MKFSSGLYCIHGFLNISSIWGHTEYEPMGQLHEPSCVNKEDLENVTGVQIKLSQLAW